MVQVTPSPLLPHHTASRIEPAMAGDKIKSKDLSYSSDLPPFLQRLHDQKAGRGDTDKHEFQTARPKRAKNPDDDDGPTIVDESGENVSKEDFQKLGAAETVGNSVTGDLESEDPKGSGALQNGEAAGRKGKENVTDGAAVKKRKVGKVVGEDEAEADEKNGEKEEGAAKKVVKKARKKAKVKLAFDDGEEGT